VYLIIPSLRASRHAHRGRDIAALFWLLFFFRFGYLHILLSIDSLTIVTVWCSTCLSIGHTLCQLLHVSLVILVSTPLMAECETYLIEFLQHRLVSLDYFFLLLLPRVFSCLLLAHQQGFYILLEAVDNEFLLRFLRR